MTDVPRISRRKRRLRSIDEPHPWEPRHMKLVATRFAETLGGRPEGHRNITLGVIQHLWRSPVPFFGFYTPEEVPITENRLYSPAPPKKVDDAEILVAIHEHKKTFARDLSDSMIPSGSLRGYFEVPTDEGWNISLDLVERCLSVTDPWGEGSEHQVSGDLAPFVWAFRRCGFCIITLYDKDIEAVRDDLLFVAKREGVVLNWRSKAA